MPAWMAGGHLHCLGHACMILAFEAALALSRVSLALLDLLLKSYQATLTMPVSESYWFGDQRGQLAPIFICLVFLSEIMVKQVCTSSLT